MSPRQPDPVPGAEPERGYLLAVLARDQDADAELAELRAAAGEDERFHEVGDLLFAAVNVARKLKVDPELALRAAADRFRAAVQARLEMP